MQLMFLQFIVYVRIAKGVSITCIVAVIIYLHKVVNDDKDHLNRQLLQILNSIIFIHDLVSVTKFIAFDKAAIQSSKSSLVSAAKL